MNILDYINGTYNYVIVGASVFNKIVQAVQEGAKSSLNMEKDPNVEKMIRAKSDI